MHGATMKYIVFYCIISFLWFPGVWISYADISEHYACSIFLAGISRKSNRDQPNNQRVN